MRVAPCLMSSLLLINLAWGSVPAWAGDCRSRVRTFLFQAEPSPNDLEQVRAICATEAQQGDADATYQLSFFSLGLGGNWQPSQAIPLIRSAADRGIAEAQYWLAWQTEAGPLLPHDPHLAVDWYLKAAAGEHRLAMLRLADAWERGELGLPVDRRKALELRARIQRCEANSAQTRE